MPMVMDNENLLGIGVVADLNLKKVGVEWFERVFRDWVVKWRNEPLVQIYNNTTWVNSCWLYRAWVNSCRLYPNVTYVGFMSANRIGRIAKTCYDSIIHSFVHLFPAIHSYIQSFLSIHSTIFKNQYSFIQSFF